MRRLFEGGVYSRAAFINLVGKCVYVISAYAISAYYNVLFLELLVEYYMVVFGLKLSIQLTNCSSMSAARTVFFPPLDTQTIFVRRLFEGSVYLRAWQ